MIQALTNAGSPSLSPSLPTAMFSAVTAAALLSLADQANAYGHHYGARICEQFEVCEDALVETCETYYNWFGQLVQDCYQTIEPNCWLEEHCY